MVHNVSFSIPKRTLGKADVEFEVNRDGRRLGILRISKGSLVWIKSGRSYGYKIGWKRFDELMQNNAIRFEPR